MNELALFAGAGGGVWASQLLGHRVVCYVERDAYCQRVLQQRIADGYFDDAPIWDDVRTFDGTPWRGVVDLVSAGFPCQPFSVAGARKHEQDERNLWPDTIRVIREVEPRLAFLENVPGLLACPYFGTILGDLAESGFDVEWGVLSAGELGAWHRRKRLWILADACGAELRHEPRRRNGARWTDSAEPRDDGPRASLADSEVERRGRTRGTGQEDDWAAAKSGGRGRALANPEEFEREAVPARVSPRGGDWWIAEPDVGRVADGVANRVDRLRALGNGQVPIVAASAFAILRRRLMT